MENHLKYYSLEISLLGMVICWKWVINGKSFYTENPDFSRFVTALYKLIFHSVERKIEKLNYSKCNVIVIGNTRNDSLNS